MNYYTPKIEELLEAIIYKETIYSKTEEGNIIEFKGLLNIEDTLHTFIEMNNVEIRYDENNEPVYYYFINPELYLLKYLDKQDIEECGFIYSGKGIDLWFKKEGEFEIGSWTSYEIKIHYGLHDNRLYIVAVDGIDNCALFQGIIKNKSELKRLLKQLNIN